METNLENPTYKSAKVICSHNVTTFLEGNVSNDWLMGQSVSFLAVNVLTRLPTGTFACLSSFDSHSEGVTAL